MKIWSKLQAGLFRPSTFRPPSQEGRVTSQSFRPTVKDEGKLSVDNGDLIAASGAWERFTREPSNASDGVMAVSIADCELYQVPVLEDGIPYPEHCNLDFSKFEKKEIERKAKHLSSLANVRGWLFQVRRDK